MKADRKREHDGRYAYDGRLERICVCGHTLAVHCAGSPADCLFYSLPASEREGQPGATVKDCGCAKFRQSRKKHFEGSSQWKPEPFGDRGIIQVTSTDKE